MLLWDHKFLSYHRNQQTFLQFFPMIKCLRNQTRFPSFKFRCCMVHFHLELILGIYYGVNSFHKTSTRVWIPFHNLTDRLQKDLKRSKRKLPKKRPRRKWLSVWALSSSKSLRKKIKVGVTGGFGVWRDGVQSFELKKP